MRCARLDRRRRRASCSCSSRRGLIGDRDRSGETVPAGEWAQDVCAAVGVWRGEIEAISESFRLSSERNEQTENAPTPEGRLGAAPARAGAKPRGRRHARRGDRAAGRSRHAGGRGSRGAGVELGERRLERPGGGGRLLDDEADSLEEDIERVTEVARRDRRRAGERPSGPRDVAAIRPRARGCAPRLEHLPATPRGDGLDVEHHDWLLLAVQGLVVIAFIFLGVRAGGIGLGLWGGVGTLVLVFLFGLEPGEPPISAMLIIIAVISAAAAMQAAGGIDYMVVIASKALLRSPKALNFVAPYVSYLLTILTGTGNTFFSIIPVINEVAYANKIRPERALAGSSIASALGITSSPVAAATATILPLVEVYGYELIDVLLITIPASIIGILPMAFVMSRHGKDLDDDEEYQRRLASGEASPPAPPAEIVLQPFAKRSVAIFLLGVAAICIFGLFEGLRPTVAVEEGGVEPMSITPLIQMFMLTAAALILLLCRVKANDVALSPIFRSGMVAMIALFGIAWMADTFIANNEDAIVELLGGMAEKWPFMIAVAIFAVAALTTSQSAATRTMVPLGLALGIGAGYMIAMWTAVVGVHVPARPTARRSPPPRPTRRARPPSASAWSTTPSSSRSRSCWVATALAGIVIVWLFFGDQTPAPPAPTTPAPVEMSVRGAAFLGIGAMVGAGIFALLGEAGAVAGSAVWLSFLLAGIVATLLGYSVVKLGVRYPSSGGLIAYLMEGFGNGRLVGIASWLGYFAAIVIVCSMVAVSFGSYATSLFVGDDASAIWDNVFTTAVVLAMVLVNVVGTKLVDRAQSLIVIVLLGVFAVFIAVTIVDIDFDLLAVSGWPSFSSIVASVALTFFAYLGFSVITFAAGDLRDPTRELPKAMYGALGVTTVLYVLIALGVFGTLTVAEVIGYGETAIAEAARPALGDAGFTIMAIAAMLATASSVLATLYASGGLTGMLAGAGQFPPFFGRGSRLGPQAGMLITAAIVLVVSNLVDLSAIASVGSACSLVIFLLVGISAYRLRAEIGAHVAIVLLALAATAIVLAFFAVDTLRNAPETFVAIVAIAGLAVVLDLVWKRVRGPARTLRPPICRRRPSAEG